jgi:hypothetical protein
MSKRNTICDESKDIINGERADDYGDALRMHQSIADGWNVIAKRAIETHGELTAPHIAIMMDWLKTCRLLNSMDHKDSWKDKIGYTALGYEMSDAD